MAASLRLQTASTMPRAAARFCRVIQRKWRFPGTGGAGISGLVRDFPRVGAFAVLFVLLRVVVSSWFRPPRKRPGERCGGRTARQAPTNSESGIPEFGIRYQRYVIRAITVFAVYGL